MLKGTINECSQGIIMTSVQQHLDNYITRVLG